MEETAKNIRVMSATFFICLAFGYLISSLMAQQKWGLPTTATLSSVLILPASIIGIIFATSSIYASLAQEEKNSRIALIILLVIAGIAITAVSAGHFLTPRT